MESGVLNRRSFLLSSAALVTGSCRKPAVFDGYAFVANEESQAVAVVDLAAFATVRHIRLDAPPTALVNHPNRPSVYVLTPRNGAIHEIATGTFEVKRRVQVAPNAIGMRLSFDGEALWVLSRGSRKLIRVPLETLKPEASYALPLDPHDFDVSAYFERSSYREVAAVSYGPAAAVSIIDLQARPVRTPIQLRGAIGTVRFRKDGKALLVANLDERKVAVIETPGGGLVTQLPLAVRPDHFAFNSDNGQLFITGEGMDAVVVVFPYYVPQVAETVLAGHAPGPMAASSEHLFIANPQAGDVSIMNIRRRRVVAVAAVGAEPGFIAVTPGSEYALVLNRKSGDMAVIRIAAILPDRRKSAALFTMIPVGSRPVSAVIRTI
jgi:DNA-binding beta-propeller fold protein YncE